jgi:hypothetical protein
MEPKFGVKTPRSYYLYWGVVSALVAVVMLLAKLTPTAVAFAVVSLISFAVHFYRRAK